MGQSLTPIINRLVLLQSMLIPAAFKILYPLNVVEMNKSLINLAFFDVLPSQDIINSIFSLTESPVTNPRYENIGFESDNFLLNVGTSIILLHI